MTDQTEQGGQPEQSEHKETLAEFLARLPERAEEIKAAIRARMTKRPRFIYTTIVVKLRSKSRRKETQLLKWQGHVTNLKYHILERLREEPGTYHEGRLIDLVMSTLQEKGQKEEEEEEGSDWAPGERSKQIATRLYQNLKSRRKETIEELPTYPLSDTLVLGTYRNVARTALRWLQDIASNTDFQVATPQTIHKQWAAALEVYAEALQQRMPFGRQGGVEFEKIGKGPLRWLLERLPEYNLIVDTLTDIQVIRNADHYPQSRVQQARRRQHLWIKTGEAKKEPHKTAYQQEHAIRADRVDQHTQEETGEYMLLGTMDETALDLYESQLLEYYELTPEFAEIHNAVELLLEPHSPRYPVVEPVIVTDEGRVLPSDLADPAKATTEAIEKFQSPFPVKALPGRPYTEQELQDLERERRNELLRHFGRLEPPRLQPLSFVRTIHLTIDGTLYTRGFCVLYSRHEKAPKVRYSLLLELYHGNPKDEPDPNIDVELYFVDNPEFQFVPPPGRKFVIIPLECGYEFHDHQTLRAVLERRRHEQRQWRERIQQLKENPPPPEPEDGQKGKKKKEPTVLKAAIPKAEITSRFNGRGHPEFFAHLSVSVAVPPCKTEPTTILGVHEHDNGYSFALIALDGTIIKLANLRIPEHVRPNAMDIYLPKNYAPEVAKRLERIALNRNALIGLEDTSWKKEQPRLSHDFNRHVRKRPAKKLAKMLADKALLAKLCAIWHTSGVSPEHMCGQCGETADANETKWRDTERCHEPNCGSPHLFSRLRDGLVECLDCGQVWGQQERYFSCASCGWSQLAMYNTATVVALQTLKQLHTVHTRGLQKQATRRKGRRKNSA